jgi:DNA gyrase subunit A
VRAHVLRSEEGRLVSGFLVDSGDDVLLMNDAGVVIRTEVASITSQGRAASGVRVMNLDEGTRVAAVARIVPGEATDEVTDEAAATDGQETGASDPTDATTPPGPVVDDPV